MILGQRRSRLVASIWGLVGLGFLAAGVILWVDTRSLAFELPAAILAFVLALAWWRQRAVLDRHGILTVHAFREHRLLWAGIDHVEVRRPGWFRAALVVVPKGGRPPISVPASAGLQRRQRNRMVELLTDLSRQHGFDVVMPSGVVAEVQGAHETPDDGAPAAEVDHASALTASHPWPSEDRADDGLAGNGRPDVTEEDGHPVDPADAPAEVEGDDPAEAGDDRGGTADDGDRRGEPAWLALLDPPTTTSPPEPDEPTSAAVTDERLVPESAAADDPERDDTSLF
ncbi:hypothetical protein [Salsipaludibacter albus]|uniref:hypothetical protein n=1 Tax=Salsipaludibacter albus TaxID=2849650 RepID=UPI001EE3C1EA|nr:hypothetical protein [Salsipaludibacter albus]MBY5161781.1 hypothetical protein [Salsipaludibacter albus]